MSRSFFGFFIVLIASLPTCIDSTFLATLIAAAHYQGFVVAADSQVAFKWYLKAARRGDADSMLNVGCAYYAGEGVSADPAAAFHWWQQAADAGSGAGKVDVAMAYLLGIGVRPNGALARRILRTEARQGNALAIKVLAVAGESGSRNRRPIRQLVV